MRFLIIAGGNVEADFALKWCEQNCYDKIIVADGGLLFCEQAKLVPDYLIGDFDTINKEELDKYINHDKTKISRYPVEKDSTDMELAIECALLNEAEYIDILGATGRRMDHALATIHNLMLPLGRKVPCRILDKHNIIELIEENYELYKEDVIGQYISLIPLTEIAQVTLLGMKYNLTSKIIQAGSSLCISNEVEDEKAMIIVEKGIIILVQSRD